MSYYRDVYLKSAEWAELKALKQSKTPRRCAICRESGPVDLHHLFYRENLCDAQTSDLRWLCRRCHTVAHDLIDRGILVFRREWSHHAMFGATKTRVIQEIKILKVGAKNTPAAVTAIESMKTPKGGWTKESLQLLGVGWPPPKGWKKKLESQTA